MRIMGIDESLKALCEALSVEEKVYYTRFGDGELLLIDEQIKSTKGNGQKTSVNIREELCESLNINDPLYMRALSGSYPKEPGMVDGLFAPFDNREHLDAIGQKYLIEAVEAFYNPVLFHYIGVFAPKVLADFIDLHIKNCRPLMFIGGSSKAAMERFFGPIDVYIQTPLTNSYASIRSWWPQVEQNCQDMSTIIISTGNTSRVCAKRLWKKDVQAHCLDIGSIVDPIDDRFDTRTCWKMEGKKIRNYF